MSQPIRFCMHPFTSTDCHLYFCFDHADLLSDYLWLQRGFIDNNLHTFFFSSVHTAMRMLSTPIHKSQLSVVESPFHGIFLPCLSPSNWIAFLNERIHSSDIDHPSPSPRQETKKLQISHDLWMEKGKVCYTPVLSLKRTPMVAPLERCWALKFGVRNCLCKVRTRSSNYIRFATNLK